MSLLDVYGMSLFGTGMGIAETTTLTTLALDATGETTGDGIATAFMPLPNKTISKLWAHVTATTGSAPTYRIKVETMSASRTPSNTPATASCWVDITASGAGAQWLGGAVVANHSVGASPDPLFVTVRYQSGTCDASNFSTFGRTASRGICSMHNPYFTSMLAGTWSGTSASGLSLIVVEYSDGTIQPFQLLGTGTSVVGNNSTWNNAAGTPLYRGNALTPPMNMEIEGVDFSIRLPDTWNFRINVYDGSTLIAQSATFDPDQLYSSTSSSFIVRIPLSRFTHPANTKYYYVAEPTTANNPSTSVYSILASREAVRALGGLLVGATGTSGFTWTTHDNGSDGYRLYPIVPVVSKIDSVVSVVNNCCFMQSNEEMIGY